MGVAAMRSMLLAARVTPRGVHRFVVLALDRKTGKTIWERVAREQEPHEALTWTTARWASSSPITDGEHVFASFESFGSMPTT